MTDGTDVKVTLDNNNVDGGTPNPSFDAQNRQSNETTTVISPANPNIVAAGANDYRMVTVAGDVWLGVYVSSNGGASWFNTMIPGFTTDTSAAGVASPLRGLDASGDPVVRFDAAGNLYVAAIAFNRELRPAGSAGRQPRLRGAYDYTPGSPGGTSTPSSAANPPNFTYARTTVVDRGAVGFAVPGVAGFVGTFTDKEWMEVDTNAPSSSPCAGHVYVSHTNFHASGSSPIVFSSSSDGGITFTGPKTISTGGLGGTPNNQGSDIAVGPDGSVYVAYNAFERSTGANTISLVKSTDCGVKWSQPVVVGTLTVDRLPESCSDADVRLRRR